MSFRPFVTFIVTFLAFFNIIETFGQNTIPDKGEIFRDDVVPRIDIYLSPDSLDWILNPNNLQSNYHFQSTFVFDNGTIKDTIENTGFRLRGNTSRSADKKSFKISFNTYEPGRKFYGLEKMNINGEHNDPTIIRSKTCWDIARQVDLVGSRANHVILYINDEYFGLYTNVEHIDEEFVELRYGSKEGNLYKCLYPADLDYLGTNPDLYKLEAWGRPVYDLKTNTDEDDYSKLGQFINVLNNATTTLPCNLEKVFNVDAYLKYIAFDILTGNWDGPIYNKNNFYLYENPLTGKIEYIPYDLDNTLGIDWLNRDWGNRSIYSWSKTNAVRPIYNKILAVPEYRDRFTFYINEMMQTVFNESNLFPHIDSLKSKMDSWRELDLLAEGDYGFTFADYETSFDDALGGQVDYGLKEFITTRYNNAMDQLNPQDIFPIISKVKNNFPNATQDIIVTAMLQDDGTFQSVQLIYEIDGQSNLFFEDMFDDGAHGDGAAGDGIYGVILPAFGAGGAIRYAVQATDDIGQLSQEPRCEMKTMYIGNSILPLYVNEIMASNNNVIADANGEYDDWIEIYNGGNEPIYLGDKFLSDKQDTPDKWQLPEVTIQAGEFLLFWADNDEEQGSNHTNFKLSASGEFVGIFDNVNNSFSLIDGIEFGALESDEAYGRIPNGVGAFQSVTSTPAASNEPLSIDDLVGNINLEVFPNPTSDLLNIFFTEKNKDDWHVQLSDLTGRIILEKNNLTGQFYEMNLQKENLNQGIYFLKIEMENNVKIVRKVVFAK